MALLNILFIKKIIEINKYLKIWIRKKRKKHIKPVMCKQYDQFFLAKRSTAVFYSSKCRLQCHRANKSPAYILKEKDNYLLCLHYKTNIAVDLRIRRERLLNLLNCRIPNV